MLDLSSDHEIQARGPFNLALTAGVLRRLPSNRIYTLRAGELRLILRLDGAQKLAGVRQSGPQSVAFHALSESLNEAQVTEAEAQIRRLLGLDVDLTSLEALLEHEPVVGPLAQRLRGMRPPRFLNLWETLVQVIPFQQVSLAAAMTMLNRLVERFGPVVRFAGEEYHGAPAIDLVYASDDGALRACGLSAAKATALRGCAERILTGAIVDNEIEGLPDELAAIRLRTLPGIGPWSVQITLLRGFGRLGNFPEGDSGAARGLRELFVVTPDPEKAATEALARLDRWRGYLYFMLLGRRMLDANAAN